MTRAILTALTLSVLLAPLPSATLEKLSLDDMIVLSTSIVRGRITGSSAAFTDKIIYTHYQIQVSETLKGSAAGPIEFVVPGGVANNVRMTFSGAPQLHNGEEYVFFLWTGKTGVTQVTGFTQGLFSVAQDGTSDPVATRNASHEVMLQRGTGRQVQDQTLSMPLSQLRTRVSATLSVRGTR